MAIIKKYREIKNEYLDSSSIFGLSLSAGLVLLAIFLGGDLLSFLDFKSFLIVVGGTIGTTFFNFPLLDIKRSFFALQKVFNENEIPSAFRFNKILELARKAKEQGTLSLEGKIYQEADPFLKKSIQLLVDGFSADDIQRNLEIELIQSDERHRREAQVFQTMGTIAPAMGLIGTLVGLVHMLKNLSDPAQLGPGMATALLTTFYGAILAYIILLPIAGKLRAKSEEELTVKAMTLEGIMEISRATNPKLIEHKLLAFLPSEVRINQFE